MAAADITNPFMTFGPVEAARRAQAASPAVFMSFGPAAAAARARAVHTDVEPRFAAQVARRADAVGIAPEGIEIRSYGGMRETAFAVRGGDAEALVSANAAIAAARAASADFGGASLRA